jgi:hypothetical protein
MRSSGRSLTEEEKQKMLRFEKRAKPVLAPGGFGAARRKRIVDSSRDPVGGTGEVYVDVSVELGLRSVPSERVVQRLVETGDYTDATVVGGEGRVIISYRLATSSIGGACQGCGKAVREIEDICELDSVRISIE